MNSSQKLKTGRVRIFFLLGLFFLFSGIRAYPVNPPDEGMWLPILIDRLNYVDM